MLSGQRWTHCKTRPRTEQIEPVGTSLVATGEIIRTAVIKFVFDAFFRTLVVVTRLVPEFDTGLVTLNLCHVTSGPPYKTKTEKKTARIGQTRPISPGSPCDSTCTFGWVDSHAWRYHKLYCHYTITICPSCRASSGLTVTLL